MSFDFEKHHIREVSNLIGEHGFEAVLLYRLGKIEDSIDCIQVADEDKTGATLADTDGFDLRDYFAAKAMQGLIACADGDIPHGLCAVDAYRYADAMLKARSA